MATDIEGSRKAALNPTLPEGLGALFPELFGMYPYEIGWVVPMPGG